ncbi:unnamed protein product [Dibothriocephalus latus]|uniref:Uncharacterized protein n=1 Tax=Dibothriocephalus latus TaxID=60516 RepID=A0A3P7LQS7_DIBLA|nr:unnamed protein product [Dibothriocephalus latus]
MKTESQLNSTFDKENMCGADTEETHKQMFPHIGAPTQSCARLCNRTLYEYIEQKKQRAEEEAMLVGGCKKHKATPIPAHVFLPLYSRVMNKGGGRKPTNKK